VAQARDRIASGGGAGMAGPARIEPDGGSGSACWRGSTDLATGAGRLPPVLHWGMRPVDSRLPADLERRSPVRCPPGIDLCVHRRHAGCHRRVFHQPLPGARLGGSSDRASFGLSSDRRGGRARGWKIVGLLRLSPFFPFTCSTMHSAHANPVTGLHAGLLDRPCCRPPSCTCTWALSPAT